MYSHVSNPNGTMEVRDLFQRAGLLYEVEKERLHYKDREGFDALIRHLQGFDDPTRDPGQMRPARPPRRLTREEAEALVNAAIVPSTLKRNYTLKVVDSPTEFDAVSEKWNTRQSTELVDWLEQTVDKFGLIPHAAGAFDGGKDAGKIGWFQARLPGEHNLFKHDQYHALLTMTNQQKYGSKWCGGFSGTRIICRNTFHAAAASLQIRIDHRAVFDYEYVNTEINKIAAQWIGYKENMEFLASRRYPISRPLTTGRAIVEYFQEIFPSTTDKEKSSRAANLALDAVSQQPGAQVKEGSWYQAFNAVTYVTDHLLHAKHKDKRELSAQYGIDARRKMKALELALDLASKSPELV